MADSETNALGWANDAAQCSLRGGAVVEVGSPAWLTIIGIGEDGFAGLSAPAQAALSAASMIVGGSRHLAMLPESCLAVRKPWPRPFDLAPLLARRGQPTCVLASGNPMLHGVGASLARQLAWREVRVIPHSSACSLAAARLGWAEHEVQVVSLLQQPAAAILPVCQPGRRLFILSPAATTPAAVAACLQQAGYGASLLWVWQRLGGAAERVLQTTAEDWPVAAEVDPLNLIAVDCRLAAGQVGWGLGAGLPDEAYLHDGQLSKQDIRAITLARLAPRPGERLWDVGAGCGSIGIEWMRSDPSCHAIAIESEASRQQLIEQNRLRLGVPGLHLVKARAPEALAGLPAPDAVFIGGGVSHPELLSRCWAALPVGGRLVANAVTLQAEQALLAWRQRYGGRLTRVALEQAQALGRFDSWRPSLPIIIYAGVKC